MLQRQGKLANMWGFHECGVRHAGRFRRLKTFVMNMAFDPVDAVLVRSAVSLAHNLGLSSVAEGVEIKGTLDLLYAMGCDLAQGYGIARPMPLADLTLHLGRRERKTG